MQSHLGEIAALATAFLWTGSALTFTAASRRIGSLPVNLFKLLAALPILALAATALGGRPFPVDAPAPAWGWLGASGLVGFVFGDLFLFQAFVFVGSRLSMLVMALAPPMTALGGWLLLGEEMTGGHVLGMALTLAGVAWAVLETPEAPGMQGEHRLPGIAFAFLGAVGQATGLILSKIGMESLPDAFEATQVRVLAGAAGYLAVATVTRGGWRAVAAGLRDRKGFSWTMVGTFFGPVFGVSASLLAVHETQAGIAAAIMSTTPVLILPAVAIQGERVSPRAVVGALLAVGGVALLCL